MNFEELQSLTEAKLYKTKPFFADYTHSAIGDQSYDTASKFLEDLVSNLKDEGFLDVADKQLSLNHSTKSYGDAKLVKREFAIIDEDQVVRLSYSNGTKIYVEVSTYNENQNEIDSMSIEQVLIDYALYAEK